VIPPERTKCGSHNGVRRIPLGKAAREILDGLLRISEFVFPADRKGQSGHLTGIQKVWVRLREKCGLDKMRLHDLRHSFASFAIINGESIYMISAVLGHSTTRMTERYLHLRDEDVRGVAERTTQRIIGGSAGLQIATES
jgi:integrase